MNQRKSGRISACYNNTHWRKSQVKNPDPKDQGLGCAIGNGSRLKEQGFRCLVSGEKKKSTPEH